MHLYPYTLIPSYPDTLNASIPLYPYTLIPLYPYTLHACIPLYPHTLIPLYPYTPNASIPLYPHTLIPLTLVGLESTRWTMAFGGRPGPLRTPPEASQAAKLEPHGPRDLAKKRTFTFHLKKSSAHGRLGGWKSAFSADMRHSAYTV